MPRRPFDRESLEDFPSTPGVYLFFDRRGRPVYVGKARNLRSRVRTYFGKSGDRRIVTRLLDGCAVAMDFIVTDSEKEALILENSLIKKHAPRFNVRLRDDKTYFSLRLDLTEEWPMLRIVRRRRKDGALYFGPYPSAQACRRTLQHLGAIFPLRTCPDSVLRNRVRPCLSHEIGRCVAPCVGLVEPESYAELVQRAVRFLRGQDTEVLEELEAEMHRAAAALQFERAADLRDRLAHIRKTLESPRVTRRGSVDRDVVGLYDAGDEIGLALLEVRDGNLAASASFSLRRVGGPDEILGAFLGQFYSRDRVPPQQILLPGEVSDLELHREILEEFRGAAVDLRVPERGEGLRLLRLAEHNARLATARRKKEDEEAGEVLAELQERLGLLHLPERMECYDISHLGGESVVGSRVVFVGGRPEKSLYRHYKLREVQRNDDFAALAEVLERRLKRGRRCDDLPDLLVIDGGRPQLARIMQVLRDLSLDGLDVIALAKGRRGARARTTTEARERVIVPGGEAPIILDESSPATHLLMRLRDEAHRFAIGYSRRLRSRGTLRSVLEHVPGVGRRRAAALLKEFGSVRGVKAAGEEAVARLPGFSPRLARDLLQWLRENTRS